MINIKYQNAYKEVLILLQQLPEEEFNKIPKEKIRYMIDNQNKDYKFDYDDKLPLNEQKISREANAIIISLFEEYFANEKQKERIKDIIKSNQLKYEKSKEIKYNSQNLFENTSKSTNIKVSNIDISEEITKEDSNDSEKAIVASEEEGVISKIINKIKLLISKFKI